MDINLFLKIGLKIAKRKGNKYLLINTQKLDKESKNVRCEIIKKEGKKEIIYINVLDYLLDFCK